MKPKVEYKFSFLWVIILSILTFSLIDRTVIDITPPIISWENVMRCIPAFFIAFFVLPITFKMIFSIPGIILTDDCLKNNFGGYSIEWNDIADMQLYDRSVMGFSKLSINLKDPEKYYDTLYKKTIYRFRQFFVANDISILIDLIGGNNEEVFATIKAYWGMKSGD